MNANAADLSETAERHRSPQQRRSRERLDRMLDAAEALLTETGGGGDGFTLGEVAARSAVSVGVIYTRVANKDDLIRRVQARFIERLRPELHGMDGLPAAGATLADTVPALVEGFAEFLRRNAPLLGPLMRRAVADDEVRAAGDRAHADMLERFLTVLLHHRGEFGHPEPERAAEAAFRIVYATLTRRLGLGSATASVGQGEWTAIKADLSRMVLLFLREG